MSKKTDSPLRDEDSSAIIDPENSQPSLDKPDDYSIHISPSPL
jgi:hypothetical protein